MKKYEFLYLSQSDIIEAGGLNMKDVIQDVEQAFQYLAEGEVILPSKTVLKWGCEVEKGRINAMPAYIGSKINIAGIKWIGSNPQNPAKYNLPRGSGLIILNDVETKLPLIIMDATIISAMRTGAATGVAAKYLAKCSSKHIGIIGAGVQAKTQLVALVEVLPQIKIANVYDIDNKRAGSFSRDLSSELGITCLAVDNPREAISEADIFVTATTAREPIIKNEWVEDGSFYAHVGTGQEDEFEVILHSDKIVTDNWEETKHRGTQTVSLAYNKGYLNDADIYADLCEIVVGNKAGRETDRERIYFNSIGMGIEDIIVATRIYKIAKEKHIGMNLALWESPYWV